MRPRREAELMKAKSREGLLLWRPTKIDRVPEGCPRDSNAGRAYLTNKRQTGFEFSVSNLKDLVNYVLIIAGGPSAFDPVKVRRAVADFDPSLIMITKDSLHENWPVIRDLSGKVFVVDAEIDPCWELIHYPEDPRGAAAIWNPCKMAIPGRFKGLVFWANIVPRNEAENFPRIPTFDHAIEYTTSGELALYVATQIIKAPYIATLGIECDDGKGGFLPEYTKQAVDVLRILKASDGISIRDFSGTGVIHEWIKMSEDGTNAKKAT